MKIPFLVSCKGAVNEWVILSFDMGNEAFGEVLLPDFGDEDPEVSILWILKGCLCVCYDYEETHLVVWLMKVYGVKSPGLS